MINNRVFITWQPVLTDHQAFTYQALAQVSGVPVIAYVSSVEDAIRKAQGWSDTQVTSVERRLIPKHSFLRYCYQQLREYRNDVHIFASPFQQPQLILCMLMAGWLDIEYYLISEPYSPRSDGYLRESSQCSGKLKATLRPWIYRCYALLFRSYLTGIFAISRLALAQYRKAGVPSSKLFLFGYFVPKDALLSDRSITTQLNTNNKLRAIFVGSLIHTKGLDLLITAIQNLNKQGAGISLDIYGPGDKSLIPLDSTYTFYKGVISFGQAQQVIAEYDFLVLPSRYDGWGVVVNEALCAGVPVVTSDTTGAGLVAAEMGAGLCFKTGDAEALSDVLARLINRPTLLLTMRQAAEKAGQALQPEVAGRYMFKVICAEAEQKTLVRSPWYIRQ